MLRPRTGNTAQRGPLAPLHTEAWDGSTYQFDVALMEKELRQVADGLRNLSPLRDRDAVRIRRIEQAAGILRGLLRGSGL